MPPQFPDQKQYAAFLFDMDGTILSSKAAAERVWGHWAERHGLDPVRFLPTMHGKRGVDTIRQLGLPGIDPVLEADKITQAEIDDVDGVVAIPGAVSFLAALPPDRWAIVTSSTKALALRRLDAAGLPVPRFMVTGDDVTIGKPNPQCYILGAEVLGVRPAECLVFEDVEAGVQAGEAAGAGVMVITAAGHKHDFGNRPSIDDYTTISPAIRGDGLMIVRRPQIIG
ncbi:glycerol phosphatase (plasmid) [Rhizobium grahamii CCGE 502]|uniref:Glycerol phosphatase n=1 Tax=Rhizobium grahamii CCGE 502 TaxID=990285 RepID=S3I6U2_9HYPH|nr:glycerol phosphatase [Rhizobium grahamii CCGE 502]